ncbi:MAG: PP2C family protein-serine/threonine phosphatase [Candidatus Rifleibacteriota bacterium]
MMSRAKVKKIFVWLFICLVLAGVPAAIMYSTIYRHLGLKAERQRNKINASLDKIVSQARLYLDQERFWCRFFHKSTLRFLNENTPSEKVEKWLAKLQREFNNEFEYIFWNAQGNTIKRTFATEFSPEEWQTVFRTLAYHFFFRGKVPYSGKHEPEHKITRKVLGQQFLPQMFHANFDSRFYSLAWTDATMKRPLYLSFFLKDGGFLLAFDHKKLAAQSGLKKLIEKFALEHQLKMGTFSIGDNEKEVWRMYKNKEPSDLKQQLYGDQKFYSGVQKSEDFLIFKRFLSARLGIFVLEQDSYSSLKIKLVALFAAAVVLLLMFPVFIYTYRTLVAKQITDLSIRWKIAFVFLFASGIPLAVLFVVAQENYDQKRQQLIKEAKTELCEHVVNFDKRFKAYQSSISQKLGEFFGRFAKDIANKDERVCNDIVRQFLKEFKVGNFYVVSSDTNHLFSSAGLIKFRGELENAVIDLKNSSPCQKLKEPLISDLKAAHLIGKKLLSDLNQQPFSVGRINQMEIVAETLMQRPFREIIYDIVSSFDELGLWGFGRALDYGYSSLIKLDSSSEYYDYISFVFWKLPKLQQRYLRKHIVEANRNAEGVKIIAFRYEDDSRIPSDSILSAEVKALITTFTDRPDESFQIVDFDGRPHIAVGFKAFELTKFKLAGFFPLDNIEQNIGRQRLDLSLFAFFCILFSLGMAQILFRSFLRPVEILRDGALAVENRDFDHRLSLKTRDEFARVADIFNHVMSDFEELEVARIVQESLLPKPEFHQNHFSAYGRSIPMAELGGDYFDMLELQADDCAFLLGDVAGHGVGAAVIMAMAKAALLNSGDLLCKPEKLLTKIHRMLLAAKGERQRRIMTFQYLYLDSIGCKAVYSNAGACFPIFISEMGTKLEEIDFAGPPLGSFKSAVFANKEIRFKHGDTMVFYTDGIVEAVDSSGVQLGYERFGEILLRAWNIDPRLFYENIMNEYSKLFKDQKAQDDLTLLVLICNKKEK